MGRGPAPSPPIAPTPPPPPLLPPPRLPPPPLLLPPLLLPLLYPRERMGGALSRMAPLSSWAEREVPSQSPPSRRVSPSCCAREPVFRRSPDRRGFHISPSELKPLKIIQRILPNRTQSFDRPSPSPSLQTSMLSAEHFALEHAAVQQLLNIRAQEVWLYLLPIAGRPRAFFAYLTSFLLLFSHPLLTG